VTARTYFLGNKNVQRLVGFFFGTDVKIPPLSRGLWVEMLGGMVECMYPCLHAAFISLNPSCVYVLYLPNELL
jgi:hypothetical protein